MNKNLTFNVAEATELGTHCALHHSYSPQEQKYIFRLDVYNQKQIKMAISQNAHHGQLDLNGFERLENNLRFEVPYRALEATKSHYNNLETALIDIGKKPVYIPYTVAESGNPGTYHLCYKQFDYLYHFVDYTKRVRRREPSWRCRFPWLSTTSPWTWATSRFRHSFTSHSITSLPAAFIS